MPAYPAILLKLGVTDPAVGQLVAALATRGYSPPAGVNAGVGGRFDEPLKSLVKLFQSQNVDELGRPLKIDGEVGPMTWGALFPTPPAFQVPGGLAGLALLQAIGLLGVMEQPPGSNSGPQVSPMLRAVGCHDGDPWCMAFVSWCFHQADPAPANPFPRTGGCLDAWNRTSTARRITRAAALANPALVKPGLVFIHDYGGGHGHTGFVKQAVGGALRTIEGNTNLTGGAEGLGVFELSRRNVTDASLKGFLDYSV